MIKALTLDLDDTLWPIEPVMLRAEVSLHNWLEAHCPEVAAAFPVPTMRELRTAVWLEHPELQHDFTATRMISLRRALLPHGYSEFQVQQAFEVFYAARNQVQLYPEVLAVLDTLAARLPLVAVSNGNADLKRIGLDHYFVGAFNAREHGAAKPDPSIFLGACAFLKCDPGQVLHVGDHPEQDAWGAMQAGLKAAWLNRHDAAWPFENAPDYDIPTLQPLLSLFR